MYFILFPINATLMTTCPDVRKDHNRKYYIWTFFMSIVWVGVYSYMMVWWATEVGCAFSIPVRNSPHVVSMFAVHACARACPDFIANRTNCTSAGLSEQCHVPRML